MKRAIVAWLVAALGAGGSASAVDQAIVGHRLIIKNPPSGPTRNKTVFMAVGGVLNPQGPTEDPRCAPDGSGAASLTLTSATTGETFTIDLGGANCGNWSFRPGYGPYPSYRYRDASGATCDRIIVVNGKRVKAVCRGSQVSYVLGADQVRVDAVLSLGSSPRRYCAAFAAGTPQCVVSKDGSDGTTYSARRCATAPGGCPASPNGAFLEVASAF